MPRTRTLKPEEVRKALTASIQGLVHAALSRRARKPIQQFANACDLSWRICQFLLELRKMKPRPSKKWIAEMCRIDEAHVPLTADQTITEDDLRLFLQVIDGCKAAITGQSPEIALNGMARFLLRTGSRKIRPKNFKVQFVSAYQARERARGESKEITLKRLAEQFTPDRYNKNPESAIRGLGQAFKRIEREVSRLRASGIASPYCTAPEHQNEK